jgi:hypothetical protein
LYGAPYLLDLAGFFESKKFGNVRGLREHADTV